ncbi:MAG: DNA methyltransferase [Actinomycetota bacterium]|nr:DNA methyltransferase [Actinomycetota bacterium]
MNQQDPLDFGDGQSEQVSKGPVTCLGLTFDNDEERRKHFTEKLREKLQDPAFREIEGFPIGTDEAILALSDPPYYTACPNPWITDFIQEWEAQKLAKPEGYVYHREPFAADVSEGKNDPIYNAHSYHTKVPHKAIMRYILHYTEPGDIVFDGFCGTGMTGVAAQLCGDREVVMSLGYQVKPDDTVLREELDEDGKKTWVAFSKLGVRRAVLNDLSPAATFIAHNYNTPVDVATFEKEAKRILKEVEEECGWMYETKHSDGRIGKINYTVWSEVFACPHCGKEVVYFDAAVQKETFKVMDNFFCPNCGADLIKKAMQRLWQSFYDKPLQKTHQLVRYSPVLISYQLDGKRYEKKPDEHDLEVLRRIDETTIADWFPAWEMLEGERKGKDGYHLKGITHLHHFYFRRALIVYSRLWAKLHARPNAFVRFFVQGNNLGFTKMNRYQPVQFGRVGGSQVNRYFSGTLFVGSLISEVSPAYSMTNKLKRLCKLVLPGVSGQSAITCQSTTNLSSLPDMSLDYIFIDPPFGNNLHYSELNFFWEAWLNILTQREPEAVMDKGRSRTLQDYQALMADAFREIYRVLKSGRWVTIEFHNSRNSVWIAIQEALEMAGFVVADVRTLDKQQETYKQSIQKLVKQDLVISVYKPNGGLEERFKLEAGTEDGAWDFVRTHLKQLPVFVAKDGQVEPIVERMSYLLFDRMVAFHVRRGVMVPLSSTDFYAGLEQRFAVRDDMYFLSDQAVEYDKKRMTVSGIRQLDLFVTDEASAIQWLRQLLKEKPHTFQEIHPQFIRELGGWSKNELMLELSILLEQNFLCYDGKGPVPEQIHAYLSTNWKELRNLPKDDTTLVAKARGRWYVPDPNKAGDLEKLREKVLLKEFEEYKQAKKKLKVFRLEAVRAGFKKAWQERDYATIIAVADKIPNNVLEEDPKLLMWYDQALTRMGGRITWFLS